MIDKLQGGIPDFMKSAVFASFKDKGFLKNTNADIGLIGFENGYFNLLETKNKRADVKKYSCTQGNIFVRILFRPETRGAEPKKTDSYKRGNTVDVS